jgi:hypothetical protein
MLSTSLAAFAAGAVASPPPPAPGHGSDSAPGAGSASTSSSTSSSTVPHMTTAAFTASAPPSIVTSLAPAGATAGFGGEIGAGAGHGAGAGAGGPGHAGSPGPLDGSLLDGVEHGRIEDGDSEGEGSDGESAPRVLRLKPSLTPLGGWAASGATSDTTLPAVDPEALVKVSVPPMLNVRVCPPCVHHVTE